MKSSAVGNGRGATGQVNGTANGTGEWKTPRMTSAGIVRYMGRESLACGPGLVAVRVKKYVEAQKRQSEPKLLIGAAEDAAAAFIAWAEHLRAVHGIPRKEPSA